MEGDIFSMESLLNLQEMYQVAGYMTPETLNRYNSTMPSVIRNFKIIFFLKKDLGIISLIKYF
jgi:hypothetical protein